MAISKSSKSKMDFKSLARRTRSVSQGLSSQDEIIQDQPRELPTSSAREVSLREIAGRPSGDTRVIHPLHALELALSIEAVGLIEPLVVDRDYHLLAGGHRLTALRILATLSRSQTLDELRTSEALQVSQRERFEELILLLPNPTTLNIRNIPVRVFEFSAREDLDRALEVETSENTLRRDYTPKELFELYERLLAMGYEDVKGRPHLQQRPVKPALALIIGQSIRTVQRKLKAAQEDQEQNQVDQEHVQLNHTIRKFQRKMINVSEELRERLSDDAESKALIRSLVKELKSLI